MGTPLLQFDAVFQSPEPAVQRVVTIPGVNSQFTYNRTLSREGETIKGFHKPRSDSLRPRADADEGLTCRRQMLRLAGGGDSPRVIQASGTYAAFPAARLREGRSLVSVLFEDGKSTTGPDHPTRASVSSSVDRATLKLRQTLALLAPPSSAASTCSSCSDPRVGGRPPLRPRRLAAARPAMTRSRVSARSYWASAPKR